jgi:lysozyme
MNVDLLVLRDELIRDEDNRLTVYDDATGEPLRSGMFIKGNPTIGVGRNLVGVGISNTESMYLLGNNINACSAELDTQVPWWNTLDPVRQRVLLNMVFNLGIARLLGFRDFLAALEAKDYPTAARAMMASDWAVQVGARASRLQTMVLTGATS